MNQPIQEYLEQALEDFETYLKTQPTKMARFTHAERLIGAKLTIESVLLVEKDGGEVLAGAPYVANARVLAIVEGETRGPKIRVFKKKRRKGMRRTNGHRAFYTRVRITDILL